MTEIQFISVVAVAIEARAFWFTTAMHGQENGSEEIIIQLC